MITMALTCATLALAAPPTVPELVDQLKTCESLESEDIKLKNKLIQSNPNWIQLMI